MQTENRKFSRNDFELIVSDVKQYAYCPRIPYYHYALPVERRATFKMGYGKERHVDLERLESRRKLRKYCLEGGERVFGVWLRSARLGLAGRLDMAIRTATADYPVEFKHTEGGVAANHRLQLMAYGMLVEERYGRPVERGFVYLLPKDDVQIVEFSAKDREAVLSALASIRGSVLSERMPEATSIRGRCADCEYRNYCADVF